MDTAPTNSSVAYLHHFEADFDADPDPSFHSYADPDPSFYHDVDPHLVAKLQPMAYSPSGAPFGAFRATKVSHHEPSLLLNFYFDADSDPASQNVPPDPDP